MKITISKPSLRITLLLAVVILILSVGLSACQPTSPAAAVQAPPAATQQAATTLPLSIPVSKAAELREAGYFMLDVRQPEEWNQIRIPGAALIPLDQLPNRLSEVPKDQPIVVYCRSGNRSQTGRDILLQAGFTNVTSMSGGVLDWAAKGYPVEP